MLLRSHLPHMSRISSISVSDFSSMEYLILLFRVQVRGRIEKSDENLNEYF